MKYCIACNDNHDGDDHEELADFYDSTKQAAKDGDWLLGFEVLKRLDRIAKELERMNDREGAV